jgi:hypothetical protein
MKKRMAVVVLILNSLWAVAAFAAPERIAIKKDAKAAKQKAAINQIKNMDLRDIEDPAARKAIGEILNYLDLPAQK